MPTHSKTSPLQGGPSETRQRRANRGRGATAGRTSRKTKAGFAPLQADPLEPSGEFPRQGFAQGLSRFRAGAATLGRFAYGWSAVWISLLLILQFTQLGLKPALEERDRLSEWTPEIENNYWEAREAFEWLEAEALAWQDPVYRERRRRIEKFGLPGRLENEASQLASEEAWQEPHLDPSPTVERWSPAAE